MEELFETIFNKSHEGIYVVDREGVILAVNETFTKITEIKAEKIVNQKIRSLHYAELFGDSVTIPVLDQKQMVASAETVNQKKIWITGNPMVNQDGELLYVVISIRDLSEIETLHKKQDTLNAMNKEEEMIGHSREMKAVIQLAEKVAKVNSTVLILGESGVGKEVIVNFIHRNSSRAQGPLVKVNCAAIPRHLLESELFGYEKGAFTGADTRGKLGLFEQANEGILFLDEIGDMPLDLQVKLLRVLQEFKIMRVGGTKSIPIDVRIISATHKNLEQMVQKGEFRQDLFYRLNIVPIKIPPLRDRRTDILPLSQYFLDKMNHRYGFQRSFHPEMIRMMEQFNWPGNIREMENLIERLVVTVDHDVIEVRDLPSSFLNNKDQKFISLKEMVDNYERKIICEGLNKYRTTRKTSNVLGISQSALVKKMQRLGVKGTN